MKSLKAKLLMLLGLLFASIITYALTCSTGGATTGSVFSLTDPRGLITFGSGGCNVKFYNVTDLNLSTGNLTLPTASGQPGCQAYGSASGPIKASGKTVTAPFYGDYVASTGTQSYSFTPTGNGSNQKAVFDLPAGHYDTVSISNGATVNFLGASSIKTLSLNGCNGKDGVIFAGPGEYSIGKLEHQAGCDINTSRDSNKVPTGKVTLHFNSTTKISSRTCINIDYGDCTSARAAGKNPSEPQMAKQYADMLQIVVHNGNFETQDSITFAGGILVENGDIKLGNGTPVTFIGEIIAKNIEAQNNNDTVFYYKSTAGNDQGPLKGFSTIAPPAIPAIIEVGSDKGRDLEYVASQHLDDDSKISGHLMAYRIESTGKPVAAASWDAATRMTEADRRAKLFTNIATTSGAAFLSISDGAVPSTPLGLAAPDSTRVNKEIIFNPNAYSGAYLNGRKASSLLGRPWRTAPIIARTADDKVNLVLFATDDGALYAVDGITGDMKWGWIPKDILPLTAAPKVLMGMHPWGQISYVQHAGGHYVTGTALSGALHFSLKLTNTGALDSIVWYDYSENGKSPTVGTEVPLIGSSKEPTTNQVGAAPGGEAPVPAFTQNADTKGLVAYIRDNKVFMRRVDTGATPEINGIPVHETVTLADSTTDTAYPTTNLIFVNKNKMAFGDSIGQVKWFDPFIADKDTKQVTFQAKQTVTQSSGKLLGITASINYLPVGYQMTLLVYDKENLNTIKWKIDDTLERGWHIGTKGSDAGLPILPSNAVLSALSTVSRDRVYVPFTIPPDGTTSCDPAGYAMGPLNINTGMKKGDSTQFNGAAISDANYISSIGRGESQRLVNSTIKNSNGSKKEATIGIADYGRNDGAPPNQGAYTNDVSSNGLKRILWREITNY